VPTREQALAYRGLRSPVRWYGGKGQLVGRLVRLVPERWNAYIEPFCGGASLFFRLPPADFEVLNDLNTGLMEVYRALADPDVFPRLEVLARFTPYSRRLWWWCRKHWDDLEDPAERAWAWWVVARQSFSGHWGHSWPTAIGLTMARSRAVENAHAVGRLAVVHERLRRVRVECRDALEVIAEYGKPNTFVYCDPPYVHNTRRGIIYSHEMGDEAHAHFLDVVLGSPAQVLVSGYDSALYRRLDEAGWERIEVPTVCHAAGHTRATGILGTGSSLDRQGRVEVLWSNYGQGSEQARLPLEEDEQQ